jgi:hypothetical protein
MRPNFRPTGCKVCRQPISALQGTLRFYWTAKIRHFSPAEYLSMAFDLRWVETGGVKIGTTGSPIVKIPDKDFTGSHRRGPAAGVLKIGNPANSVRQNG